MPDTHEPSAAQTESVPEEALKIDDLDTVAGGISAHGDVLEQSEGASIT